MYIFGDCHIGSNRRNKWLYKKAINVWKNMVEDVFDTQMHNERETVVFAGDLWDSDRPTPNDFMVVKDTFDTILNQYDEYATLVLLPGNHDRVGLDGVCPADIFNDNYAENRVKKSIFSMPQVTKGWDEYGSNGNKVHYHYLPYSADIIEKLGCLSRDIKDRYSDCPNVLISHFTTKDMNVFAGIISEDDPVFDPFDVVILGDCHICYDNGRFHSTGSTFMFNVDEMYSKRCIPSYVHIDNSNLKVERITHKELKPTIINDETEAIDDDTLYLIVSEEVINTNKPNVFVKYKHVSDDGKEVELNEVEIKSINKEKVFEIMYPDLTEIERRLVKMYANGEIEIMDVVNNEKIHVVDRTNQLSEIELEAEVEGLLNEEVF